MRTAAPVATPLQLSLACGDYAITRPIIDGEVQIEGVQFTVLTAMDAATRNWRFLHDRAFDVAEFSCSSYLPARDQGEALVALPVFLHRRFRHGFVYINTTKGIREPADLIGKKVGMKTWQVSAILWARGVLESEYGVPQRSIDWYAELDEDVPFEPPPGLRYSKLPADKSAETMLAKGELDALLSPNLIKPLLAGDPRVGRLFPHYKAEEARYYRKTGVFPIMHLVAMRRALVDAHPWLPGRLFRTFEQAKAIAMRRMADPTLVPLAWYGSAWDEERDLLGPDPWEYGLTRNNRRAIETLVGYSLDAGLIRRRLAVDELFLDPART